MKVDKRSGLWVNVTFNSKESRMTKITLSAHPYWKKISITKEMATELVKKLSKQAVH